MSKFSEEKLIDHLYYNKLPEIYRIKDLEQKPPLPLYRYLMFMGYGGFSYTIDDAYGALSLVDPEECPKDALPYLLESFGIPYHKDIPEIYQRRLLANVGELVKRRGTYNCIKYLSRALTGMDVDIERKENRGRVTLSITMKAETAEQVENLPISLAVFRNYLKQWVPFWLDPYVQTIVNTQDIEDDSFIFGLVVEKHEYDLVPEDVKKTNIVYGDSYFISGIGTSYSHYTILNDFGE